MSELDNDLPLLEIDPDDPLLLHLLSKKYKKNIEDADKSKSVVDAVANNHISGPRGSALDPRIRRGELVRSQASAIADHVEFLFR